MKSFPLKSVPMTPNNLVLFVISVLLFLMLFTGIGTGNEQAVTGGVTEVPA